MPSNHEMYYSSNNLLPYRCPSCSDGKRFRSLIALRLHTSIIHDFRTPVNLEKTQQHNGLEDILTKRQNNTCQSLSLNLSNSSDLNNKEDISSNLERAFSSTSVDKMFDKYSEKMDEAIKSYDSKSRKLENKLKLARQLEEIRMQKQQLHRIRSAWQAVHGVSQLVSDTDAVVQSNIRDQFGHNYKDTNITESQGPGKKEICDAKQDQSVEEQLNLSIQLAAKYKALALDAQGKLHEKIEEEKHMKQFFESAAQKEYEAKQKLSELMESLLQRTEEAESKLQTYESEQPDRNKRSVNNRRDPHNQHHNMKPKKQKPRLKGVSVSFDHNPLSPMTHSDVPDTPTMRYSDKEKKKSDVDAYVEEILEPPSEDKSSPRRSKDRFDGIDTSKLVNPAKLMPFSNMIKKNKNSDLAADRRVALFCVFMHLRSVDLLRCGMVCREWRDTSRYPQLWSRIRFHDVNLHVKLLHLISKWSHETCSLCLKNIGMISSTSDTGTGVLEEGLEMILKTCGDKLLVLSIDQCDPLITSRVLWFVSCYNRRVNSISYRSSIDPLSRDVALALGSVCRDLVALEVAPSQPCLVRGLFDNNVARLLSWCWPQLQAISFGGIDVDGAGLLAVALNCQHLKVLELDHARGVKEEIAQTVCKHGLKELHTLLFTHTPIQASTVLCFLESLNLRSLHIVVSQKDYFTKTKHKYTKMRSEYAAISKNLLELRDHPKYRNIIGVYCE